MTITKLYDIILNTMHANIFNQQKGWFKNMRKVKVIILILALIFTSINISAISYASLNNKKFELTQTELEYLQKLKDRTISIVASDEVMYYLSKDGKEMGMLFPIIEFMRNSLGLTVEVELIPWNEALELVQDKKVELTGLVIISNSRMKKYYTSKSLYDTNLCFITRLDNPLNSIFNLKNKKIGLLKDSAISETLDPYLLGDNIINYYSNTKELLDALERREIDVATSSGGRSQIEVAKRTMLQYEVFVENSPLIQGLMSNDEEMKMLLEIIDKYILSIEGAKLKEDIVNQRKEAILEAAKEYFEKEIEHVQENYEKIEIFDSASVYPLCFLENGEYKGMLKDIEDIFTILTKLPVVIEGNSKYVDGFNTAMEQIEKGECQIVSSVYLNPVYRDDDAFKYSQPIWTSTIRMYTYKKNINDLKDCRIGTTNNAEKYLNWNAVSGKKPQIYSSRTTLVDALRNDEIDVAFMSEMTYDYYYTILNDRKLRAITSISAMGNLHMIYGTQNEELNFLFDQAIKLHQMIHPDSRSKWTSESMLYKDKYIDMQNSAQKMAKLVIIGFSIMLIILAFLLFFVMYQLRRYSTYDNQIVKLLRTQQNFDLAWGNLVTKRYLSKGNHNFFRKWGLNFPDEKCTFDDISKVLGYDMDKDYNNEMEQLKLNSKEYSVTDKEILFNKEYKYYRRYYHRLNDNEFMVCLKDITDEINRQQELKKIATTDFLTKLINRRAMDDILHEKIDDLKNNLVKNKAYLILMDIDNFKNVNDLYGHEIGDIVLKKVAGIIKDSVYEQDIPSRWGGEEFLILTYHPNLDDAVKKAQDILRLVENGNVKNNDQNIKVTISAGISEINTDRSLSESIKCADNGLYKAKREGKNCVRVVL